MYDSILWNNYLSKFLSEKINITKDNSKSAVIVEPRKHKHLLLVIKNFFHFLKDWNLIIFHGTDNEEFVKEITKDLGDITLINIGVNNLDLVAYNNLLTSEDFYNSIPTENILIFQTDTILRKPIPDDYLEYDYVGAPWNRLLEGCLVGNGGLSLRRKSAMIKIIKERPYKDAISTSHPIHQLYEDVYFSLGCLKLGLNVAPFYKAQQFSVETIFHEDPIGLHKPYSYLFDKTKYEKLFS